MLSSKQCKIARTMTQDTISDTKINEEFKAMSPIDKLSASKSIDKLIQLHNMPIDKGFNILVDDFKRIANEFNITQATLFCFIYNSHFCECFYLNFT